MSIFDRFIRMKNDGELSEKWLLNQKIEDLFDFMCMKLVENDRPVSMTIMYLDVKYTVTCEKVDDFHEELKKHDERKIVVPK